MFGSNHIFVHHVSSNDYEKMQSKLTKLLYRKTIFNLIIVMASFSLMIIGPTYGYFFKNQYIIPTGAILPFIDINTTNGFLINCLAQGVMALMMILTIAGIELFINIICGTFLSMNELTVYHMRNFTINIRKKSGNHFYEFRNILFMTEDIIRYTEFVNEIYYWRIFSQPTLIKICSSFAILCHYVVRKCLRYLCEISLVIIPFSFLTLF